MILSEPVAASLKSSAQWQPDAKLNRTIPETAFFSEYDAPAPSSFVDASAPPCQSPGAISFRHGAAALPGATPEGQASVMNMAGDAAGGRAENTAAHNKSSPTLAIPADPALPVLAAPSTTVLDEESLRQQYDAGFAAGMAAGRADGQREMAIEKQGVRALLDALNKSLADPQNFFLPLERLAIHIAEQLVRGELSLSGAAIRRLVENALLELEHPGEQVSVRLNPEDLEQFSLRDGELSDLIQLVRDPALSRGSVKLEMAGGTIDDFIENRLDALARSVLGPSAEGYPSRPARALQTLEQEDVARFQARPVADRMSVEPPALSGHNGYGDVLNMNEDEAR